MTKKGQVAKGEDEAEVRNDFLSPYLGPILKQRRKARNRTQEGLAKEIGINDATLRKIEKGQGADPDSVKRICKALGLDLEDVVGEALFKFWSDFQGITPGRRPLERLLKQVRTQFNAYQQSQADLLESLLQFASFVHFQRKWEEPPKA